MTTQEAIRILTLECDDWETSHCNPLVRREAFDMAIEALQKWMPEKPMISIDVYNNNLRHLYCPTCGTWIGMWNKRLRGIDMHNNTNKNICAKCGQAIDCSIERLDE